MQPKLFLKDLRYSYLLYPLLVALFIFISLKPYYEEGSFILGGEGSFIIDFLGHLEITIHNWVSRFGVGGPNFAPMSNGGHSFVLALIDTFFVNPQVANFILIFSIFYLPFLGMYFTALQIGSSHHLAVFVGLFYLINPATLEFLNSLNPWNAFAASLIPILCWIIARYYRDNLKLFFFYGITTALFSNAFTNAPLNIVIVVSSLLSVYIISLHLNGHIKFSEILKKSCLIMVSLLMFNFWWIASLFYFVQDALAGYTRVFAQDWLVQSGKAVLSPIAKSFSLTQITPAAVFNFHGALYNSIIGIFLTLVPLLLVLWLLFYVKTDHRFARLNFHIFVIVLLALFLLKGVSRPLGFIYQWMFDYIPFFMIFKTPQEKFGLLYTFFFSILLLFVLHSCKKNKIYPKAILYLCSYLLFCAIPFLTGNIIPDYYANPWGTVSRQYFDRSEYLKVRKSINKDKLNYRVLSLPGRGNYQALLDSGGKNLYSGLDPVLLNTNKPIVNSHDGPINTVLYHNIFKPGSKIILDFLNIKKLTLNDGFLPWFGNVGPGDKESLKQYFKSLSYEQFGSIAIYDRGAEFLPLLFSSDSVALSFKWDNFKVIGEP